MIEGRASPFLAPLVGLQCTLVGPIKKVLYHIIEVTYNAHIDEGVVYLVGQSYDGSCIIIRRGFLKEIMLTEESRVTLIDRLTSRDKSDRP